ncbi:MULTISPECIES: hypothetical protein [unclassified Brevundimonas]|uniref:hypothetical protein n=1 Tax=unclassified Brevundimonas TaxID=2622653 RepID=UPI000CFBC13D|nr:MULTISPECIES: hypothetical protein [unclassified Brevundimonas]PRA36652.1 hypothetical protein CQ024_00645 [Brevundimonas sp. MYb27]PQZ79487.1 hypothetical protein CQ026_11965 [Brevundimonas sp. MYb31]PRB12991.1 hypothetical protein CQ039_13660 [Brevundimonas sp. MYb52]PRB33651.1 hypothetical protein CQ035_12860 [Brevundimonas sp. MYb46]PRB48900.1 hypothetical protein CQ028_08940 [Brevundimonas sp. MYb33]
MTDLHDAEIEKVYLAQAWEGAVGAVKAAMALNGGASVAILAFIGSLLQEKARSVNVEHITLVMMIFCVGLVAAALTQLAAYFTVYCYHQTMGSRRLELPDEDRWALIGTAIHISGIVLLVASYGCFVGGAITFANFARLTLGQ